MGKYCRICGAHNNDYDQICFNCNNVLDSDFQNINGSIQCSNCGASNDTGSSYCYNCGNSLVPTNYDNNYYQYDSVYGSQASLAKNKSPWLIVAYILIGVLLISVIILGVYLFFFKDSNSVDPAVTTMTSDAASPDISTSGSQSEPQYLEGNTPYYNQSTSDNYSSGNTSTSTFNDSHLPLNGYTIGSWQASNFMKENFAPMGSSYHEDFEDITYGCENLYDNNPATAWVEGSSGNGVGESFLFHYHGEGTGERTLTIDSFDIITGYGKSSKSFNDNTTPVQLRMSVDGNSNFSNINLQYTTTPQRVELAEPITLVPGQSIQFEITKVRKGSTDTVDDACISEVKFNATY